MTIKYYMKSVYHLRTDILNYFERILLESGYKKNSGCRFLRYLPVFLQVSLSQICFCSSCWPSASKVLLMFFIPRYFYLFCQMGPVFLNVFEAIVPMFLKCPRNNVSMFCWFFSPCLLNQCFHVFLHCFNDVLLLPNLRVQCTLRFFGPGLGHRHSHDALKRLRARAKTKSCWTKSF